MNFWDQWYALATSAGVPQHLADLGREVMRDVHQRGCDQTITLGAEDDGQLLIDMMLLAPISAETRLTCDACSRRGLGDEMYALVDQSIARRLAVAVDVVEEMRQGESRGLDLAHRLDAQRRPQNYDLRNVARLDA